ncbi:zf-HC2 domain-containing protein [Streptomyces sp. GC420]|uniref:anti-sigma factor n=1 Tax=Streptomyces sp. GC420 TaxID=2697568 RepID=UPI001415250E|nr:zf-HC2 domain-containing protein [Streptomyces sp. GC420]NBM18063.1 hypothetical protein [Streptomyces sp. GC420]
MTPQERHRDVGAYALGVLDRADAFRFEEHLTDCAICAVQLSEFAGTQAFLTTVAGPLPERSSVVRRPGPGLLDRLLGEVAVHRRRSRRRRLYLVAAAATLIVTAPLAAIGLLGTDDRNEPLSARAKDPTTGVVAEVRMWDRGWGTDVALKLSGVWGPLKCELVAIATDGDEQTVGSWAVPEGGYGMPDSPSSKKWLSTQGGTAMPGAEIDRFEIRTMDGERLVTVDAGHGSR